MGINKEPTQWCSYNTNVEKYGLIKAILIDRIKMWCKYNEEHNEKFEDGFYWSGWMRSKDFSEQIGLPLKTVAKNLKELVDDGIIIKGNFNKKKYDKTGWYRFNYSPTENTRSLIENTHSPRENTYSPTENGHSPTENTIPVNPPINLPLNLPLNQPEHPENTSMDTSIETKFEKKSKLSAIIKERYPIQDIIKYVEQRNFKYIENVGRKSISTEDMEIMEEYNNINF